MLSKYRTFQFRTQNKLSLKCFIYRRFVRPHSLKTIRCERCAVLVSDGSIRKLYFQIRPNDFRETTRKLAVKSTREHFEP